MAGACSGGMSWLWEQFFDHDPPWEGCCVDHDALYREGGTPADRRIADARLLSCVALNGHPIWAILMWAAVRVFGRPHWGTA